MSKYINSDDVYYGMRKHEFEAKYITRGEFVDSLPSADVVEVVRCKDCKHFVETSGTRGGCFLFQGMTNPRNDDFCSEGERKESKVKRCFDIPKDVAERLLEDTERKEADD